MAKSTSGTSRRSAARATKGKQAGLPSREALLAWLENNPGQSGKREVSRAFNLKGQQKIELKSMLKQLEAEGVIRKRGKRFAAPGALPPTAVLDISERDGDGILQAYPVQWNEADDGPRPKVAIARTRTGPTAGVGDRVLARIITDGGETRARVMKVVDKNRGITLGVFRRYAEPEGGIVGRIEPVDRKQNELLIFEQNAADAPDGALVEVSIVGRNTEGLKQGRIDAVVGDLTSEKAISLIALHQFAIPTHFAPEAIAEAKAARPAPIDEDRADWRDLPLITIDPADAKDHDDAVHAVPDTSGANEGGVIVTVAIADVAWYVRPKSEMDREAAKRGNSVYFPDRVVPMLPERISTDLCSLRENEERPALAVRMTFAPDGRKLRHAFHRVMMKSHARLAYEEAQAAIDGRPAPRAEPWLEPVLRPLWSAYEVLKRGRAYRQPLELDLPERKIMLNDDGSVDRIIVPPRLDAHKLIEEFMIQANVCAAETLEKRRQALIYRIHDQPSMAKLESLRDFLRTLQIPLAKGQQVRPAVFNDILEQVAGGPSEELVNSVVLRSQSQAEYNPENIGHFGLNLKKYAHFTSPIRRYADLIVHRALIKSLALGEGGLTRDEDDRLEQIAQQISDTERRAMLAERQTKDRLIAVHLADRIGAEFDGRINGVTRSGLFVTLSETGADGFIPISKIGDDYYSFDETSHSVTGDVSGAMFQMGDDVRVRLVEAAPMAGALRFEMVSEGREGTALVRSRRSRPQSPSGRPRRSKGADKFGRR